MRLRTDAHDCLYLNWAVPRSSAPALPEDLTYETHLMNDTEWIFVSALLFRFVGLRARVLPLFRMSYPQMNLRTYVRDSNGAPSVLYLRTWVPVWVWPMSRAVGRQRASAGSFSYPSPSTESDQESWTWRMDGEHPFEAVAKVSAPVLGDGPDLGDWTRTVRYFQRRRKGYAMWDDRFRTVDKNRPHPVVWPMEAEILKPEALGRIFPMMSTESWSIPHSAWLCPQIPLEFQVGKPMSLPLSSGARMVAAASDC